MSKEIAEKLKGVQVLFESKIFIITGRYDQPIIAKKKPKTLYEIQPIALFEASLNKDSKLKVNNSYNKWVLLSQLSLIRELTPEPIVEQPVEPIKDIKDEST